MAESKRKLKEDDDNRLVYIYDNSYIIYNGII